MISWFIDHQNFQQAQELIAQYHEFAVSGGD